ncbi:tetratricopeptide repeat protein [Sunxiuqinia sp. A32]|uniref:tetratricopeptide repeat protein n=1 Tax=Sunxiuqinia sp. A32 TaxID=3461496 RepID=UPI004045BC26
MKRFFLVIAFCFGMVAGFAQDAIDAVQLKNDGNEALRAKDYKKALELFDKAVANWGDNEADNAMIYNAGYCAYKVKAYDKAVKYFDMSIATNYKTSTALLYKANAQLKLGNEEAYVATLNDGLAKSPNDAKFKDRLTKYYLKEGNAFYKKGAAILSQAAADVTAGKYKTTDDQYKQATANAKVEFKKALPLFEKALEIDPTDATAKQLKDACTQAING